MVTKKNEYLHDKILHENSRVLKGLRDIVGVVERHPALYCLQHLLLRLSANYYKGVQSDILINELRNKIEEVRVTSIDLYKQLKLEGLDDVLYEYYQSIEPSKAFYFLEKSILSRIKEIRWIANDINKTFAEKFLPPFYLNIIDKFISGHKIINSGTDMNQLIFLLENLKDILPVAYRDDHVKGNRNLDQDYLIVEQMLVHLDNLKLFI